jgi:MYXO-CTERM domain-containing protein
MGPGLRRSSLAAVGCGMLLWARDPRPEIRAKADAPTREPAAPRPTALAFEANLGQLDPAVRFAARGAGFAVWLTERGARLAIRDRDEAGPDVVLGLEVAGAKSARALPTERFGGRTSYLRGRDPAKWVVDVPRFARVTYPGVRPGVDLVFHGEDGRLEYDFVLAPGTSPDDARLEISGSEGLSLDETGALLVATSRGVLRQLRPMVYQEGGDGIRRQLIAGYRIVDDSRVAFAVPAYDPTRTLVIDPVLLYASYLGGSSYDRANAVAVDASGNVYLAGLTSSPDFPTESAFEAKIAGSTDVFVAKLDPEGKSLLYATYLGGAAEDAAYGIAVDASGSAYVTGNTESSDFPVFPAVTDAGSCPTFQCENGGASNAFVTRLAPDGRTLTYSTYLGGSGYDVAQAIGLDVLGSAYLAGVTQSPDFPTVSPFQSSLMGTQNAFVAKLSPTGTTLLGGTYLGGSGDDAATGIAVDGLGAVYVTGYAQSLDFPTAHALQKHLLGNQNAFVTELVPSFDALAFSTYLGGSGDDAANAMALDASGHVYLAGATTSSDFPVKGAFQSSYSGNQDAFLTELEVGGGTLAYSTFLGGSSTDIAASLAIDRSGAAYVVGQTESVDFPVRGAFQPKNDAADATGGSAFVAILDASGRTLVGASYLGGKGGASGQGIALGPGNAAWIVGAAGVGLPTPNALFASFKAETMGGQNAFLARVSPEAGTEIDVDSGGASSDSGLEGGLGSGTDASGNDGGPGVVVVPAPSETPVATASSGCGCRVGDSRGGPPEMLGAALLIGALLERRRRGSSGEAV